MATTQCPAAKPDRSGAREHMWFDYMIRAADWVAGAVAARDRQRNLIPGDQPKCRQMLEEVISRAENIAVLHFDMTETAMQFRRIAATPKKFADVGAHISSQRRAALR